MKSLLCLLIVLPLVATSTAFSANANHLSAETKKHLTIKSVQINDVTELYKDSDLEKISALDTYENIEAAASNFAFDLNPISQALTQVDLIVDKIVNIGQKIWNVVDKGRPVANFANQSASALPGNTLSWDQLENWQVPKSKVISVVYKNMYGATVVKFTYRIVLLYGGSVNGLGKYIGYASVEPVEMTTAYMYNFDAKANVNMVYNMGTKANPLAGMLLNVAWTVGTVLKKTTITHTYNLDGLGNITVPADTISNGLK